MTKYRVCIPYICWVGVTLEADSEDDAIERALGESQPMQLVGNGGCGDKMIGVNDTDDMTLAIEVCECEAEGNYTLKTEVEEVG